MSEWTIDWFSSAAQFTGWAEHGDEVFLWRGPPSYDPLVVYPPRTWLLRAGWQKIDAAGREVSPCRGNPGGYLLADVPPMSVHGSLVPDGQIAPASVTIRQ